MQNVKSEKKKRTEKLKKAIRKVDIKRTKNFEANKRKLTKGQR